MDADTKYMAMGRTYDMNRCGYAFAHIIISTGECNYMFIGHGTRNEDIYSTSMSNDCRSPAEIFKKKTTLQTKVPRENTKN